MPTFRGRWETVGERLGEGGAGEVYVVRDLQGDPEARYALKRLKNPRQDRLERFKREVEVLRRLDNPHVLHIVDDALQPENAKEKPYFVTELAEKSLAELDTMQIGPIQLLRMFLQVCDGVRALHRERGVHRDIKPENILVRLDGSIAVGDFGIAYLFDAAGERVTETFEQVGSRYFICPEGEEGRVEPTHFCDIYSLGKLLYWMLSGGQRIARASHREVDIVTVRRNYWLEHVNVILDDMLQVDPARRPTTITAVMERVEKAIWLMEGQYNPLTRKDQGCRYCGSGTYRLVRQDEYGWYGITPRNTHTQRLLRCSHCGHVEFFFVNDGTAAGDWLKAIDLAEF